MEDFPIILQCENVFVAVPITTLMAESSYFKSMFEVQDNRRREDLLKDADSSGEHCEKNEATEVGDEKATHGTSATDEEGKVSVLQDAENTNKDHNKKDKVIVDDVVAQADIYPIRGFQKQSVKIVFGYLTGYTGLLEKCSNIPLLVDMLKICHSFHMESPVGKILARIEKSQIDMENLIDVVEACEELREIERFSGESDDLFERCVGYARCNFASWQVINNFVKKNTEKISLAIRLFDELKNGSHAVIRRRIEDEEEITKKGPSYIIKNLEWSIECKQNQINGVDYLGIYVSVKNPNGTESWVCDADWKIKLVHQTSEEASISREGGCEFDSTKNSDGIQKFKAWSQVFTENSGFFEDDSILVEVEIHVSEVRGMQDSLGLTEKQIGWFSSKKEEEEEESDEEEENETDQELQDDSVVVVLTCGNISVSLPQSRLVHESKYFRTRLSNNWMKNWDTRDDAEKADFTLSRTFNITGGNPQPKAVKILFEYLAGYDCMLGECKSFSVLADMLCICDYYLISSPVSHITEMIDELPLSITNMIEAYETAQKLATNQRFQALAKDVQGRCISFARSNLASWQCLISFIADNCDNVESVVQVLENLYDDTQNGIIRTTFSSVSSFKLSKAVKSPPMIFANFLWKIEVAKAVDKEQEFIYAFISCKSVDNTVSQEWSCDLEDMEYCLDGCTVEKAVDEEKKKETHRWCLFSIWMSEAMKKDDGFIQDDAISMEVRIKVENTSGIPTCLGISEKDIR